MTKYALVHDQEAVGTGCRVCQVENTLEDTFPVDETIGLHWVECPDEIVADMYFYNSDNTFVIKPNINVVTNPVNQTAQNNTSVTFSVSATVNDDYTLTYEWYSSTDNGMSYDVVEGEASSELTFVPTMSDNNKKYYAKISTSHNISKTTQPVILTVYS